MQSILTKISIPVDEKIFLKDPISSDLGKKILVESVKMIAEIGMEQFTFKKLAKVLETTESSIYRYFDSKHKLLIYLITWYWGWMEYRLTFAITNIPNLEERLKIALKIVCNPLIDKDLFPLLDMGQLQVIIISESSKAYFTKEVDMENKDGFFKGFKRLCKSIADIMAEINPQYPFPNSLAVTIIEGVQHQKFFAAHLPSLSDAKNEDATTQFFTNLALKTLSV